MKKEEILTDCIEQVRSGKSTIEECIARYPELGYELRTLLAVSSQLKPDKIRPSPEFVRRTEAYLYEEPRPVSGKQQPGFRFQPRPILAKALVSALTVLVILGVAGGGTAYAAQRSLPGDMLYTVKTYMENTQLALTTGSTEKANLYIKLAERRVAEVTQQVNLNRSVDVQTVKMINEQLDNAIKVLGKSDDNSSTNDTLSRLYATTLDQQLNLNQILTQSPQYGPMLHQTIDNMRRGNTIAKVAYTNEDFLKEQPSVTDKQLDIGEFKIEGLLLKIDDHTWNVGGTIIENVHFKGNIPTNGSRVKIEGLVRNNKTFLSLIETIENKAEPTIVEGQFAGTDVNGIANVGGIPVNIEVESNAQLKPGDNVELQGSNNDDIMNVTEMEERIPGNGRNVSLKGILKIVQADQYTVTVISAGHRTTINISQAEIEIQHKRDQTISLSEAGRLIGHDVKLDGLYKNNGIIFARQVKIYD